MTTKQPYLITQYAGTHVAGRLIQDDERDRPIHLTEEEARYELQIMAIRPWEEKPHEEAAPETTQAAQDAPAEGDADDESDAATPETGDDAGAGENGDAGGGVFERPVKPRSKRR